MRKKDSLLKRLIPWIIALAAIAALVIFVGIPLYAPQADETVEPPTISYYEDGKKKKVLDKYVYDQGICMYCEVCVRVCPQNAITFDQSFETAVFDRQKLVKQLNKPGSKCEERKPVARPAAAAAKPAAADKAAEAPKAESAKDATADKTEV